MKICSICKRTLTANQFHKDSNRKDGLQPRCKECANRLRMEYYYQHKDEEKKRMLKRKKDIKNKWLEFIKKQSCVDCGENRFYVLELDHVNGEKDMNISDMVASSYSWERIKNEIQKCQVRCANCHRTRHYKERIAQLAEH